MENNKENYDFDIEDGNEIPQHQSSSDSSSKSYEKTKKKSESVKAKDRLWAFIFAINVLCFFGFYVYAAIKNGVFPLKDIDVSFLMMDKNKEFEISKLFHASGYAILFAMGFTILCFILLGYRPIIVIYAIGPILLLIFLAPVIAHFTGIMKLKTANLILNIVFAVIAFFYILSLYRNAKIAAFYIKYSVKIIAKNKALFAVSVLLLLLTILFGGVGVIIFVYFILIKMWYISIILLFQLLWISEVIICFQHTVTAGIVASWCIFPANEGRKSTGRTTYRTLRYNFGTIALGSLIQVLIDILVSIIKELLDEVNEFVGCIGDALMSFIQEIIEMYNRYLFIGVALEGHGFAKAAKKTKKLFEKYRAVFLYVTTNVIINVLTVIGAVLFALILFFVHTPGEILLALLPSTLVFSVTLQLLFLIQSGALSLSVVLTKYASSVEKEHPKMMEKYKSLMR